MAKKLIFGISFLLFSFASNAFATLPTLILKNQFGEQSNNFVLGGTGSLSSSIAANSILSNLTGSSAAPVANSYSAVGAVLPANQVLSGFVAGAGTVSASDTTLQALQKLAGDLQNRAAINNLLTGYVAGPGTVSASDSILGGMQKLDRVAAHQANSTAPDVATLVTDFNALLAKLQAAGLMQ